jgi:site-specific DNA-methyltransferase (adenine-specific)
VREESERRRGTATSNFGVSRREAHDSSGFYSRFAPPVLSSDDTVLEPFEVDEACICGDIRQRDDIPDGSVALVVTSPPYFAGKQYEEELGRDGVPSSYAEYLDLLRTVFERCVEKLEPGGRIAVNVANLGRKPYRSLAADVIAILQDDLRLLLRGEVIWKKGEGAGGNCAWGSYRSAANPVIRDITERVVIASKGRFDRAKSVTQRAELGLPHRNRIYAEDFMQRTLDVWDIPPESARRVGHPAPFPVELPEWLIGLYTYEDDLVLDPFMGSGSTLVAAAQMHRRCIGYDLDEGYVATSRKRLADARSLRPTPAAAAVPARVVPTVDAPDDESFQARATREGKAAQALAEELLVETGFRIARRNAKVGRGVAVSYEALDADGNPWWFDVSGAFTSHRGGLLRTDTVWKSIGRACVLSTIEKAPPLVLLSSDVPRRGSEGDKALHANPPGNPIHDVVGMLDEHGFGRLVAYASGITTPLAGFWTAAELTA